MGCIEMADKLRLHFADPSPSVCFDFALRMKEWEADNLDAFVNSLLGQRLFVSLAKSRRDGQVLRMTDLYVDTQASAVGLRKRIAQCVDAGFFCVLPSQRDGRARVIQIEPKFDELLGKYVEATNRMWLHAVTQDTDRLRERP